MTSTDPSHEHVTSFQKLKFLKTMAEVLVSSLAGSVLGRVVTFAVEHGWNEVVSDNNVRDELEKLQRLLAPMRAVFVDAEKKQCTSSSNALKVWQQNLQDVMYDIDDIVDDASTEALKFQVNDGALNQLKYRIISPIELCGRIRECREKLDEITANAMHLGLHLGAGDGQCSNERQRESYSFVYQPDIIGRDDARDKIVHGILSAKHDDVFVFPLHGLAGIGKTALAKMVYHDPRVRDGFSSRRMWACVSIKFDLKRILQDIIESATGESCKHLNLEHLQRKLREILQNGSYFLVLDDMWTENRNEWEELRNLLSGSRGSIILVTTRKYSVADMVRSSDSWQVEPLPFEKCMEIFTRVAFKHGDEKNHPRLVKIGESIVKKCAGVPLLIKAFGSVLFRTSDERQWLRFQNDSLWKIIKGDDDVLHVLMLSYDALPADLRPCFSYLSIFPKTYEYYRRSIIMLWKAQGLLPLENLSEETDQGNWYIDRLVGSSFFQDPLITFDGSMPHCKMHDLLHHIGRCVLELDSELATVSCEKTQVPETVRHLVWDGEELSHEQEFPMHITKARKARTFACSDNHGSVSGRFLEVLLSKFLLLRVLIISEVSIDELPDSIGSLKHLRYLDLTWNRSLKFLPNSICELINLETLDLYRSDQLAELPTHVNKLISLRYLSLSFKQKQLPEAGLGGWASLTSLQLHSCSELTSLTDGIGCLTALEMLWISDCLKLPCLPAAMKNLSALRELLIDNCPELDLTDKEEAMNGLQSLGSLQIVGLPKLERLPDAFCSASASLRCLLIEQCPKLRELPDCMQHRTDLRVFIQGCPSISRKWMELADKDCHLPVKSSWRNRAYVKQQPPLQ
ncbi:hypothetical protein ABZP36_011086 [Zizania latifolia]